jgi:hypothetical protein
MIFVLVMLLVLAMFYLWRCNPLALGCPKDVELVTLLRDHREAFERLRTMAIEDSNVISYVTEDTLKQSTLSEARCNEYRHLLSGIERNLVIRINALAVSFSYSSGGVGLAIARSWMKGIAYLPDGTAKIGVVVKSLDELEKRSVGVYLVPIEGNWYLVYTQSE